MKGENVPLNLPKRIVDWIVPIVQAKGERKQQNYFAYCVNIHMRGKKTYPYPSYKNPIRLSPIVQEAREQLRALSKKIMENEPIFQRRNDKIPALPFWIEALNSVHYRSWCFECFEFIREALRHGVIKNRHDARFWGLGEKKALCGDCLEKRLKEMPVRKQHLWKEYQKRGYWEIN